MPIISARVAGTDEDLVLDGNAVVCTDRAGRVFGMAPGRDTGRIHPFAVSAAEFVTA